MVEVWEGGGGPPGSTGKGGRSAKEGIEEMNWAACRGAVHRSAGARSVGLLGQEKRCSVGCGAEPQSGPEEVLRYGRGSNLSDGSTSRGGPRRTLLEGGAQGRIYCVCLKPDYPLQGGRPQALPQ